MGFLRGFHTQIREVTLSYLIAISFYYGTTKRDRNRFKQTKLNFFIFHLFHLFLFQRDQRDKKRFSVNCRPSISRAYPLSVYGICMCMWCHSHKRQFVEFVWIFNLSSLSLKKRGKEMENQNSLFCCLKVSSFFSRLLWPSMLPDGI